MIGSTIVESTWVLYHLYKIYGLKGWFFWKKKYYIELVINVYIHVITCVWQLIYTPRPFKSHYWQILVSLWHQGASPVITSAWMFLVAWRWFEDPKSPITQARGIPHVTTMSYFFWTIELSQNGLSQMPKNKKKK